MNTLRRAHWLARGSLAFLFAYHGVVPKLLWLSPGELSLLKAHGLEHAAGLARLAGVAELLLAVVLLLLPRLNWPLPLAGLILLACYWTWLSCSPRC